MSIKISSTDQVKDMIKYVRSKQRKVDKAERYTIVD